MRKLQLMMTYLIKFAIKEPRRFIQEMVEKEEKETEMIYMKKRKKGIGFCLKRKLFRVERMYLLS